MDQKENDMMTRVGPGTPAGETLRKYWLPVSFSTEIKTNEPKIVRRLARLGANVVDVGFECHAQPLLCIGYC